MAKLTSGRYCNSGAVGFIDSKEGETSSYNPIGNMSMITKTRNRHHQYMNLYICRDYTTAPMACQPKGNDTIYDAMRSIAALSTALNTTLLIVNEGY